MKQNNLLFPALHTWFNRRHCFCSFLQNTYKEHLHISKAVSLQTGKIDAALDDVKEGRINHYASLDELKAKFANV